MPTAEPAEWPATQLRRFEAFTEGIDHASRTLVALKPEDLFKFVLQHLDQCWRKELEIQTDFRRGSSKEAAPGEADLVFQEKYVGLALQIARDCLVLSMLKQQLTASRRPSLVQDELEVAMILATSWGSGIQKPRPWSDEVLRGRTTAGFLDRLAARLDIARGVGTDVGG